MKFLSQSAQDFIEESTSASPTSWTSSFLSQSAQDFIEDKHTGSAPTACSAFLSQSAQDFIEDLQQQAEGIEGVLDS